MDSTTSTTQKREVLEKKLSILQLNRLAAWLFIMGSFFYLYSFDEDENSLLSNNEVDSLYYEKNAANAVVQGSTLVLIAIIILTIMAWEKLELLRQDPSTDPVILDGQSTVVKSGLIKIIGFWGATTGYITIADELNRS